MAKQPNLEQTIGNLTRGQLEEIIKEIAQKTIKQEMIYTEKNESQALAATFDTWKDERDEEAIIQEIYESRYDN